MLSTLENLNRTNYTQKEIFECARLSRDSAIELYAQRSRHTAYNENVSSSRHPLPGKINGALTVQLYDR